MKTFAITILFLLLINGDILPQCSDAGVCILGKNPVEKKRTKNSFLSLSYSYGKSGEGQPGAYGDDGINYSIVKLEGEIEAFEASRLGFSLPYSVQSGPIGSAYGLGDLSLYWMYLVPLKNKAVLSIMVGGKFASGNVNTEDSLPQSYQSGLGTNDFLLGVGYNFESFSLAVAYQKPFGRSANYITKLKRGDDLLFRAGYSQTFNRLNVKAELLTILRLQESSVQNPLGKTDDFTRVDGSNEFQVNITAQAIYNLSNNIDLHGTVAVPLLKRDYNLDGLRRSFTISVAASYLFNLD